MRWKMLLLVTLFAAPLLAQLKGANIEAALNLPPNLAPNPSFEAGAGNAPPSWHFVPQGPTPFGTWDGTVAHTGTHSLKLTTDIVHNQGCHPSGGYRQSDTSIPLNPSRTYYVSAWFKVQTLGSVTTAPNITVLYVDTNGVVLGFDSGSFNPGNPASWIVGTRPSPSLAQAPAGTTAFKLLLGWASNFAGGACPVGSLISCWYDDLNVTGLDPI